MPLTHTRFSAYRPHTNTNTYIPALGLWVNKKCRHWRMQAHVLYCIQLGSARGLTQTQSKHTPKQTIEAKWTAAMKWKSSEACERRRRWVKKAEENERKSTQWFSIRRMRAIQARMQAYCLKVCYENDSIATAVV